MKKKKTTDKAKRNRRIAIGAGVAALAGLAVFLASGDSEAKDPSGGKAGGGGGLKGGGKSGGGSSSGGGGAGPSGTLPGADDLPAPKDDPLAPSPRRTTPSGGGGSSDGGARRVSPSGGGDGDGGSPRRTNPPIVEPTGPDPRIKDLPGFYNDEWPDPGKFYQVGGQDSDGLYGIAWRWFYTCLFLAARNAGGLDDDAASAWAAERVGSKGVAQAERADYILCVAWNDIVYGSYTVASKNRRGPHGRGIDLVPQHGDNWRRILDSRRVLRNVYLGTAGAEGTPRNAGAGDARLPLLWMPRLDDQALWSSGGSTIKAAGTWANGWSFYHPPPVVMKLGILDATQSAGLGVWGCGEGQIDYEND